MNAHNIERQLSETTAFLGKQIKFQPKLGFVLGSGLGSFANQVKADATLNFSEVPHFVDATVEGHSGKLLFGKLEGVPVMVQQGRLHAYEGLPYEQVVYPIRVMAKMGVKTVVITNAAGGLLPKMKPGHFMLIDDQINLTGNNPLRGHNVESLGPRFVDMTQPFDPALQKYMLTSFKSTKAKVHRGVYVGVMGPSYETAAEIQFFKKIGGGAVGMSTVAEVLAARHCGMKVLGLSCITNLGTGLSKTKLSHAEVKDVAEKVEKTFTQALLGFTQTIKAKNIL